jgi:hypothetical protein
MKVATKNNFEEKNIFWGKICFSKTFQKKFRNFFENFPIFFSKIFKIFFHQEKNIFFPNFFWKNLSATCRCLLRNCVSKPSFVIKLHTGQKLLLLLAGTVDGSTYKHVRVQP